MSQQNISIPNVVGFISFDHNNHDTMHEELTGLIDNLHILHTRINYSMDATELCPRASLPLHRGLVSEQCQCNSPSLVP